ncbi:MAG: dTDP-glucose 4,6-dehydratase [Planctomycetota bacterium]|nr:dTDP-glucose 4,6-dehydratase [Planctomycetota bacterium]MDA1178778.1 dTDP-glucose 4,6-dehydratase [Planctomycetota bacterium]
MNNILITGGAGFIGGTLVRQWLLEEDLRMINLDALTYAGNLDSLTDVLNHPRHVFVQGDIADRTLVLRLLNEYRPIAVVNLAAESHVDRSIDGPRAFLQTNVIGTFKLLSAVLQYWQSLSDDLKAAFRFLHVSTDEVFGSLGPSGLFTESTAYAPNSPYAASKAAADHFVRAFHHTYGLPTLTTNGSNNYGPYQFPEKLIPLIILNALEGKPLPVYGNGQNVRDWLFVDDHCRGLRRVLDAGQPGATYNISGNCERSNLQIVHQLCDIVDESRPGLTHAPCRELIQFVTDRPGHDLRYAVDNTKITRELGWSPKMSLETGLRQTVNWYVHNTNWIERVTSGKYRRERLGLGHTEK